MDSSPLTSVDAEICREMPEVVCGMGVGETGLVVAAVLVDAWALAVLVLATVTAFSGDDALVVSGAGVEVVTGDAVLVFSAVEVQVSSLEANAATGVAILTSSVRGDEDAAAVFASGGVLTLADFVVGEGEHIGRGSEGVAVVETTDGSVVT